MDRASRIVTRIKYCVVDVDRVIVWWKGGEINKGEIVRKKKGKKREKGAVKGDDRLDVEVLS